MMPRPKGTSIGRIKDQGNYTCGSKKCAECKRNKSPRNGFWMTPAEQGYQRRIKNMEAKGIVIESATSVREIAA
jgi:hypothetical protein